MFAGFLLFSLLFPLFTIISAIYQNARRKVVQTTIRWKKLFKDISILNEDTVYLLAHRLLESINGRIDACEDFVEFACGKQFELFERLKMFNGTGLVEPTTYRIRIWWIRKKLQAILGESVGDDDTRGVRYAKLYWQKCTEINPENVLTDVRLLFKRLGGWPVITDVWNDSHFSWDKFSKCSRRLGFLPSMFIHIGVNVDDVQRSWSPNDTIKLTIERPVHRIRRVGENLGYLEIAKFLTESRLPDVTEINEAVEFGNQFHQAECQQGGAGNLTKVSIGKLQELYPMVNWMKYLRAILTPHQGNRLSTLDHINVDTCFLSIVDGVLESTDKRVLANYAFLTIIDDLFRLIRPQLALTFATDQLEVQQICLDSTATMLLIELFEKALDTIIARLTNKQMKIKITEIENRLVDKLLAYTWKITWMNSETRINTVMNMKMLSFINLYPDDIFNDKYFNRLELFQTDAIRVFFRNINVFLVDHYYRQAGRPRNKYTVYGKLNKCVKFLDIFSPSDLTVKPDFLGNRVYVPAASVLTRRLHFSPQLDTLNYATIGRDIAVALTSHVYQKNSLGIKSVDDTQRLKSAFQQLISRESCRTTSNTETGQQFNSPSFIFALIGGAEIAYRAVFESCTSDSCMTMLPGLNYTSRQLFWISTVASDCDRNLKYRYNTAISNIPEFSRDFNCPSETSMSKTDKCTLFL